jgi:hypothetical protein
MPEVNRRRTERLVLTFPIRVEGADAKGQPFSENARTLVVNRHGARIRLKRVLTVGQTLHIVNLVGNRAADFRVVGLTQPLTEQGGEWGVECRDEQHNIWGIDFPPLRDDQPACSVILECRRCHQVGLTPISLVEYDVLDSAGLLPRECKTCGQFTSWGHSQGQVGMPPPEQIADPSLKEVLEPPPPEADRRINRRASLRLPIRVRNWYGTVECAKTENVSKGGLAFVSEKHFELGEALLVTCPYDPGAESIEVRASVARCLEIKGSGRFLYGLRYEKEA